MKSVSSGDCGWGCLLCSSALSLSSESACAAHCWFCKWSLKASWVLLQGIGLPLTIRWDFFPRKTIFFRLVALQTELCSALGSSKSWSWTHLILSLHAARLAWLRLCLAVWSPNASACLAMWSRSRDDQLSKVCAAFLCLA